METEGRRPADDGATESESLPPPTPEPDPGNNDATEPEDESGGAVDSAPPQ